MADSGSQECYKILFGVLLMRNREAANYTCDMCCDQRGGHRRQYLKWNQHYMAPSTKKDAITSSQIRSLKFVLWDIKGLCLCTTANLASSL